MSNTWRVGDFVDVQISNYNDARRVIDILEAAHEIRETARGNEAWDSAIAQHPELIDDRIAGEDSDYGLHLREALRSMSKQICELEERDLALSLEAALHLLASDLWRWFGRDFMSILNQHLSEEKKEYIRGYGGSLGFPYEQMWRCMVFDLK